MWIKCPECNQKFDVPEEYIGKEVECGACDHVFTVPAMDDELVPKRSFYPGDKGNSGLGGFSKSVAEVGGAVGFEQAQYKPSDAFELGEPAEPRHILAAIMGVVVLVLVIVMFIALGREEGVMRDMETPKRFIFTGFAALVGGGLLLYGIARKGKLAWFVTLILSLSVLSLPVIFPANPVSATVIENPQELEQITNERVDQEQAREDYLFEIGHDPVKKAIAGSSTNSVVGIYLRSASKATRMKIASYLYSATDEVSREISYDRGAGGLNGLILLVEQEKNIDEIALLCEKFGEINKIIREHRVIDVMVDRMKVGDLDDSKALDPEDFQFQQQNLRAMQNIDPELQIQAVKRLTNSEPKALRADVTAQMVKMLPAASKELKIELIRGLKVWSQPGDGAEKVVFEALKELHSEGAVEKAGVEFLFMRGVDGADVLLIDLWKKDPVTWRSILEGLDKGAEIILVPMIADLNDGQIVAAADILSKVGTSHSLPYLKEAVRSEISAVAKKSLQAAIDEIEKRS